ncbi:MAG TPA: hypothetical protein VMT51_15510 [Dongiaceae bacterium]|nr:hypothetical protein [Dongiaceae bacterium]
MRYLNEWPPMKVLHTTTLLCALAACALLSLAARAPQDPPASPAKTLPDKNGSRGQKLVLKDGTFQLVREYQRNGDRVRYLSAERGDWEELPAALVDWDATTKAAASAKKDDDELVSKVHHIEEELNAQIPWDVDASLQIAPGVFLPPGEGMFAVEGKSVTPLNQVGAETHTDKKQVLKQILSPVPLVPSKRNVELPGAHSVRRINSERPEFYLREAPEDPDRVSPIQRSSRPGERGPEIGLFRLTVKGNKREIQSIRTLFGEQVTDNLNLVSTQRWDLASNVFRFTLSQDLPAGEYAFAEILPDGLNLYVWDFGVDRKSTAAPAPQKK